MGYYEDGDDLATGSWGYITFSGKPRRPRRKQAWVGFVRPEPVKKPKPKKRRTR